jgi:tetratricopeptide (TPR) repeat protein
MRLKIITPLVLFLLLSIGWSQSVNRILVLPFDTTAAAESYGLGLAVGVQRALNTLEGIYAPPVGDGALFVNRAFELDLDSVAAATRAFEAESIISGEVRGSGSTLQITIGFAGPRFPGGKQVTINSPASPPDGVMRRTVEAVVSGLGLSVSPEAQARLDSVTRQVPSVESLGPVSWSAARLGTSLGDLAGAFELDSGSSWVQSEYARALALAGQSGRALEVARSATAQNPADIEARVVEGIILLDLENLEEAATAFSAALAINSWHAHALTGIAQVLNDTAMRQQSLERAIQAYPRLLDAHLELARLADSEGRALQQLRRAAANLPESISLHRSFVKRTLASGDAAGVLAYLQQNAQNALAASPALYALAIDLPDSLASEALAFVRQGAAAFPESTLPALAEARLLRRTGQDTQAVTLLRNLHTAHPADSGVTQEFALALAGAGELAEAATAFALIQPDQLRFIEVLLQDGQARAALQILEPLVNTAAADADLLVLYGLALARTGDSDAARTAFDQALALDAGSLAAARGKEQLNELDHVTGGVTIELAGQAASAFQRGLGALDAGDLDTAVLEFGSAWELSSEPLTAFYQGYALQLSGRPHDAITAYERALTGFPDSDIILNNLGYSQLQTGRYDRALPNLRAAISANPENAQAQLNLGLAFYGLQRYGDAAAAWDTAVALNPGLAAAVADLLQDARDRSR